MKKSRTPEEIQRQIKGLEAMKEWLPKRNFFGDDNWGKIDAQVSILKGDKDIEDFDDAESEIHSAAYSAYNWKDGVEDEDLFEEK